MKNKLFLPLIASTESISVYSTKSLYFVLLLCGKKFLLRHFFGQVLNRKNPSFIRASLLSKECFISPRFCLLEFKITSNLEKYFCGFIHV